MEKYTKLEKIGKGSFGSAYLVERKNDNGKKYVIKEIMVDPRDQKAAIREAKLLMALDHPNIIACKESFMLPGAKQVLCIVTEYADGGDLRKKLKKYQDAGQYIPENEILDLFVQCCLALKHIHDRKILHRDIKPENIFLMRSNIVKLGDFGVAKVLSSTLQCADTMTGTPYYTSPEICYGKKYNHKTDIWSLGCVLYEMATLNHAFNGRNQRQLFQNIATATYAPIPSKYSSRLQLLITEMLNKNPRDRPSVNVIIKKPIVLERIQSFLSERAMADEFNHTVLHGQHILMKPSAPPAALPVAPPAAPVQIPRKSSAGGMPGAGLAPNVIKAVEYKPSKVHVVKNKAAAKVVKKTPSADAVPKVKAVVPKARPAAAGYLAPTKAANNRSKNNLLKKKKEIIQKVKEDAQKMRQAAEVDLLIKKRKDLDQAKAAAFVKKKLENEKAPTPQAEISGRIAAFNIQWQEQRQHLLNNLPLPPPAAGKIGAVQAPVLVAPPSEVACHQKKASDAYPKPVDAKALKQAERDAIRKSIRADIREKKLLAKAAGSPLDDPIILVQNLPDYASREKEGAVASTENLMPPPPPSMPPSSIMEANATADIEGEEEEGEENEEEDCEEGEEEEEDEKEEVDDGDESEDSLEEVEEQSDDANVRMNRLGVVANKPVNLEYERMVLQLKSVVESGDVVESDDDDDEDEDENEELPSYDQSAASPIKNISPTGTLSSLDCVMLQDEAFKNALRTLVKSTPSKEKTPEMKSFESKLGPEKCQALLWLSEYMNEIMN